MSINMVQSEVFMTLIAILVIFSICMIFFYCHYWKKLGESIEKIFKTPPASSAWRKYDGLVVCSPLDSAEVWETVIAPLTQRGYSIAWHQNAYVPGEWIMKNVEKAVRNSARILVFGTKNLISSKWGLYEIRRGRYEEFVNPDFEIMALVTKTLPKKLKWYLYELVCLRSHIKLTDRDYVDQICSFLPPLDPLETRNNPSEDANMTMKLDDLLKRYREIMENERQNSTVRLPELYYTHRRNDKVSIRVDIATVFAKHVCDDSSTCPTCSDEHTARTERFKPRDNSNFSTKAETTFHSLQEYVLDFDDDENITEKGDENSRIRRRCNSI